MEKLKPIGLLTLVSANLISSVLILYTINVRKIAPNSIIALQAINALLLTVNGAIFLNDVYNRKIILQNLYSMLPYIYILNYLSNPFNLEKDNLTFLAIVASIELVNSSGMLMILISQLAMSPRS